ncbi:hypothetical protein GNI_027180, partial [Gregarina niphandrodes]
THKRADCADTGATAFFDTIQGDSKNLEFQQCHCGANPLDFKDTVEHGYFFFRDQCYQPSADGGDKNDDRNNIYAMAQVVSKHQPRAENAEDLGTHLRKGFGTIASDAGDAAAQAYNTTKAVGKAMGKAGLSIGRAAGQTVLDAGESVAKTVGGVALNTAGDIGGVIANGSQSLRNKITGPEASSTGHPDQTNPLREALKDVDVKDAKAVKKSLTTGVSPSKLNPKLERVMGTLSLPPSLSKEVIANLSEASPPPKDVADKFGAEKKSIELPRASP